MTNLELDLRDLYIQLKNTNAMLQILEERMNQMMVDVHNLKVTVEDICDSQHNKLKIPHRCPVCNGDTVNNNEPLCIPCDGKGIVWPP